MLIGAFLVTAESFKGKKVIGAKGAIIGQIDAVDINIQNWTATHIRVALSEDVAKQLGFRTGFVRSMVNKPIISLPVDAIENVGDVITIKDTVKDIKDLELVRPVTA